MTETKSDNVFELISSNYYELTASEKKIADHIIANPDGGAYSMAQHGDIEFR